jgi:hypothetical protein
MEVEGATLKHPEWKSLAELWNEMYPEDHPWYFADYRDFRRSYMRGRDAIAFPIFR